MNPEPDSLLDMPELVLVKVSKLLRPSDLASTMQTCTALHSMLRPRLTAMVRPKLLNLNLCLTLLAPYKTEGGFSDR